MTVDELRDELDELSIKGHGRSAVVVLTPEWEGKYLARTVEHTPSFVGEFDTMGKRRPNTIFFNCPY